ncbi:hypothetical protein VTN00DRAFT_1401 [Thermoascus crustaceus]|uniref:uncharacterized protein n=1 Tax=Thermoascus crustaceus TaxID=5088 RepID=UPI003743CC23
MSTMSMSMSSSLLPSIIIRGPLKPTTTAVPTTASTTFVPAPRRLLSRSYSCLSALHKTRARPNSGPLTLTFVPQIQSQFETHRFRHYYSTNAAANANMPLKKEFLCIIPDKPGVMAKRMEVRPTHIAGIKPLVESGFIAAGGAMMESHPTAEGETPQFKGSMIIALAETAAEVKEQLAKDVYAVEGVWDLEKAQIIPFKSAVRVSL